MIKINDKFTIERYQFGWQLHETKKGMSRENKAIEVTDTFFYGSLPGVIQSVLDKVAGAETITDLKSILVAFKQVQKEIVASIDMAGIKELCKVDKYVRSYDSDEDEPEELAVNPDEEDDEPEAIADVVTIPQRRKL